MVILYLSQAQRQELGVMQALETLNDAQVGSNVSHSFTLITVDDMSVHVKAK